jgi:hypothetical protein
MSEQEEKDKTGLSKAIELGLIAMGFVTLVFFLLKVLILE